MHYTLNQLRIFLRVVRTQSITKAAEELHLTQPAVSIQLRNFQAQFDIPLTEVVGRKVYITDFGREIAESVAQILDQVSAINHKTLAFKGQLTGRLHISVVSTGTYVMPFFLSEFMARHAGIELVMDVTNKRRVVESLENNEVDFALVSILPAAPHVEQLDLLQNKLYLVGNAELHNRRPAYDKEVFRDVPLIFREKGSGTRQTMEAFIASHNVPVLKKMELTSNEAVKQAVLAGLGYSIMPLIGIRNELHNNELQIIAIEGMPIKTMWSLIWLRGKRHSPVAASLLAYMRQEKDDIVRRKFDWYEQY